MDQPIDNNCDALSAIETEIELWERERTAKAQILKAARHDYADTVRLLGNAYDRKWQIRQSLKREQAK